jgi:hypothetical protein
MKLSRKGEWSITVIAGTVLILIVLVTLIVVFREQIANLMGGFTGLSNNVIDGSKDLNFGELTGELN